MKHDAYYRQRYKDELVAAETALSPEARERHRELASLYLAKANSKSEARTRKAA